MMTLWQDVRYGLRMLVRNPGFTAGVVLGVGAGSLASLWLTRYLAGMLYAVKPADLLTFVAVAALLIGVAAAACVLPVRRAARVDSMMALRGE